MCRYCLLEQFFYFHLKNVHGCFFMPDISKSAAGWTVNIKKIIIFQYCSKHCWPKSWEPALQRRMWGSISGHPSARQAWTYMYWRATKTRISVIQEKAETAGVVQHGERRLRGDLKNVFKYLMRARDEKDGARLFSV